MAMTLDRSVEVLDAMLDIRGYCNFEQCQAWATIRAHLSAQAKVQVNNAGLPRELRLVCGHDSRSVENCIHCEAADALESFAARLSQGTQGDGISVGVDVTNDGIAVVVRRFDAVIYSEFFPTERAAVPDGWEISGDDPSGYVTIRRPNGEAVHVGYAGQPSHLATSILRDLAVALITAAPQPAGEARTVDEGLYYLQDSRSYVGNCPTWWAKGRSGYTTKLDEAHRFTFDEAMRQHRERDTDIPWPCAEIDALARRTVDMQHMRSIRAQCDLLDAPMLAGKEGAK